ncbi:hypothetical protein M569_02314 [Genlisea aurea]|uniref:Phytocyanin domain-containing protein n=1 Tax=Genlisea aurea TaxID=192259 RepID=S8CYF0_9LAMI|nr:hypothetical protein M569_02314 [Genlisea aurea]
MAEFSTFSAAALVMSLFFLSMADARDLVVGGKANSWTIPLSDSDSLNRWAEKSRFVIGDSLVWNYDGAKDSVLEVSKNDYFACNTSDPIKKYSGGSNTVKLERSGPYYFISGAAGHCEKGQKVIVVVISERWHSRLGESPSPSPAIGGGIAVAPTPASGGKSILKRRGKEFLFFAFGALMFAI